METSEFKEKSATTGKYRLFVDKISDEKNFGTTTSYDKIMYNLKLLPEEAQFDIESKLPLFNIGTTIIRPMGRFITVISLKKDERNGSMTFYDFDVDAERMGLKQLLLQIHTQKIVTDFFQVSDFLLENFTQEDDLFELSLLELENNRLN
tara:strand:+ start:52 stop:501 length:450 start_codon:yes stop_codon:yes gene_type:complete